MVSRASRTTARPSGKLGHAWPCSHTLCASLLLTKELINREHLADALHLLMLA